MLNNPDSRTCSNNKSSCRIDDFSNEVLSLIDTENKGELYENFIRKFLMYIPLDYRTKNKFSLFGDFTDEAFEFFQNKKIGKNKIEIKKCEYQKNPAITVIVAMENKAFIIDSINSLISKMGLQVLFTFHPIINVSRDEDGNLLKILDRGVKGNLESIVYLRIIGNFNEEEIDKIKNEILNLIYLVDETYNSWQIILNEITGITTNLVEDKANYDKLNLNIDESVDFLNWLQKNNITFLGAIDFQLDKKKFTSEKGVKSIWENNIDEIWNIIEYSKDSYYENKILMLGKINKLSPVHRNVLVDYILVKKLDKNGNYTSGHIIFGLYGTAIYFQSINQIPILREKMDYVIDQSVFPTNGYSVKKIKNIIESLPRDILIQIDKEDLYCMTMHMLSSMHSKKLKLFIEHDVSSSFVNVIIFVPRERLTPEVYNHISHYLSEQFKSPILADNITVVSQNFAHFFATFAVKNTDIVGKLYNKIEKDLVKITTNWSEALLQKLCEEFGEYKGGEVHKAIEPSFPVEYRSKFDIEKTIDDIQHLELASKQKKREYNLIQDPKNKNNFSLKIYSPRNSLTLSDILPSIENLGFIVIDEQSFLIKESTTFCKSWIYEFHLKSLYDIETDFALLKKNIEEALRKINENLLDSDTLSKLLVTLGINWRQIKLLKSFTRYIHQTAMGYDKEYVQQTLVKHHKYVKLLLVLFEYRFNPQKISDSKQEDIGNSLNSYLDKVESGSEDKVLRNLYALIMAMVRTNFYQTNNKGEMKEYISFKLLSSKVPDLPEPIPYAEIFVYSNSFEAVHLRGGKVARGGLRWSDRKEDYRVEVLGLMKAQMTKNTVIVPVGSKGCFYVNIERNDLSVDDYMEKVVHCYKNFLRGLLDLTDNLVDTKIVHPENTIIYDDENPYLVVAADKGTATFSDYANSVSKEYNFWLGDAFASGGSAGYDHKKMAITAKGAWISAQQHFIAMSKDIQKTEFTVTAIGDMSGDVFGNGMLLSKYIKLIAAFNHQHIFIDPNPNHEISFKERERLFNLARSKWSDYNKDLISKGGAIFSRSSKMLTLTKEIKELLNLKIDSISPDNLINVILKTKVDLLWNGGIGTYVKSSVENNVSIGDKANDSLRVNGNELGAKVVSEGGNLGMSQLGRIEYSLKGGILNTDFIDNSAGVDCSDHEVNIKIALNIAVSKGKLNLEERNKILYNMTKEVEELVLKDNYEQNIAITVLLLSPTMNIEYFSRLIKELENTGLLNSEVEFLPNKSELSRRAIAGEGMTRPELCTILSYSKMSLDQDLIDASLTEDKYFKKYLVNYFPKTMQDNFIEEIENHPLKSEIIRTIITNKVINRLGGPIISAIKMETGAKSCDIARAFEIVSDVFYLDKLWKDVVNLDMSIPISTKVEMLTDLNKIMRRGISWFVKNMKSPISITDTIEDFSKQIGEIVNIIGELLIGTAKSRFFNKINYYVSAGVEEQLAKSITTLEILVSAFDIIYISKNTKFNNNKIANLYFEVGELLNIDWLRYSAESLTSDSYWDKVSVQSLKDDFYDKQRQLVMFIVENKPNNVSLKKWLDDNLQHANIFLNFIEDIKMNENINLNMIILANKKLEIFLRKLRLN